MDAKGKAAAELAEKMKRFNSYQETTKSPQRALKWARRAEKLRSAWIKWLSDLI